METTAPFKCPFVGVMDHLVKWGYTPSNFTIFTGSTEAQRQRAAAGFVGSDFDLIYTTHSSLKALNWSSDVHMAELTPEWTVLVPLLPAPAWKMPPPYDEDDDTVIDDAVVNTIEPSSLKRVGVFTETTFWTDEVREAFVNFPWKDLRSCLIEILHLVESKPGPLTNETFVMPLPPGFSLLSATKWSTDYHSMCYDYNALDLPNIDEIYLKEMTKIIKKGHHGDSRNAPTISLFGQSHMTFSIDNVFPVLTTKRFAWKACVEELLWFLRGDTNSKNLEKVGVNIWKGNTTREFLDSRGLEHLAEGEAGPNYSHQWRNFGGIWPAKDGGVDQIAKVIESIKKDPTSRRHVVSAWNPVDLDATALPPCHILFQFYVSGRQLSCQVYQRSADWFLGVPFNIASYALLTHIIAAKTNLQADQLHMTFGVAHIYKDHLNACETQLSRTPRAGASLVVDPSVAQLSFEEMTSDLFTLVNYVPHGTIAAPMIP